MPVCQSLGLMIRNWGFMCNNIIFSLNIAAQNTYATIIGEIAATFGYSDIDITIFGVGFIFGGMVGSVIFGLLLEKYKIYKTVLLVVMFLSTICPIFLYLFIDAGSAIIIGVLCVFMGAAMISISVVCFDLGVE